MSKKQIRSWQVKIINGVPVAVPYDPNTQEWFKGYKENQLLTGSLAGTRKPRSIEQLRLYWVKCGIVAENARGSMVKFNSKERVSFYIKHTLKFYDDTIAVSPSGDVQFMTRSISMDQMEHIEANNYFKQADIVMAAMLGCTLDEFLEGVKL